MHSHMGSCDGNLIFLTFLFKTCFDILKKEKKTQPSFTRHFIWELFSKFPFSGFLKLVSIICKMSFDIFEKDFHALQEI